MQPTNKFEEYNSFVNNLKTMYRQDECKEIERGLKEIEILLCRNGHRMMSTCLRDVFKYTEQVNAGWLPIFEILAMYSNVDPCEEPNCEEMHVKVKSLIETMFQKKHKMRVSYLTAKMEVIHIYGIKLGLSQYEETLEQTLCEIVKQKCMSTLNQASLFNECYDMSYWE